MFAVTAEKQETPVIDEEENITEKKEETPVQEPKKAEREQKAGRKTIWRWYALALLLAAALIITAVIKRKKSHSDCQVPS